MKKLLSLLLLTLLFSGCGAYSPYVEKEVDYPIGFKLTTPEVRDAETGEVKEEAKYETVTEKRKQIFVNPAYVSVLSGAKEVNSLANPTPSAPIVNLGISAILAGLGAYAAYRNRGLNAAVGTLVDSVEKFDDPKLKLLIQQKSAIQETAGIISKIVQKRT